MKVELLGGGKANNLALYLEFCIIYTIVRYLLRREGH